MGDRGNVVIKEDDEQICLYTHWDGLKLPKIVADALSRGYDRIDDFPYLTRIIFSEMIKDDVMGTTGYGIYTKSIDPNYPDIVIDLNSKNITYGEETLSAIEFMYKWRS